MGDLHHKFPHSLKVPVVTRPEYTLSFERAGTTFIHCDVHVPWTATVKRKLLADWEELKALHTHAIYAQHKLGDHKHLHFLKMFGFRRHGRHPTDDAKDIYVTN